MKKIYFLATALFLSLAVTAQTTIDINELNPVVIATFESETVIDVYKAASQANNALISIANPLLGSTTSEIEISFDVYTYGDIKHLGTLVSFVNITSEQTINGRMYFSNGSYLGFNNDDWYDINAGIVNPWDNAGTNFIGNNVWRNVKLRFSADGYAVYVDNVLAFNTTEGTINRNGILTDHTVVMDFLKNTATNFLIGTGSWWGDNTNIDNGEYWDAQNSYMKNITISPNFTTSTKSDKIKINNANVVSTEFFSITGANVGTDFELLQPGVYVKKATYSNGVVESSKIVKGRN